MKQTEGGIALNADGTVGRVRSDGSAFVVLDERSKVEGAHPFPADDERRAKHVLALPVDCELARGNAEEKRIADRDAERPVPGPATFGRDHWSTFAYIETLVVDKSGKPDIRRMRCDPKRHPLMAHQGSMFGAPSPTRLKDGVLLPDHDDWDCVDELEAAGLIEVGGTGMYPVFALTELGRGLAALLRAHKAAGGNFGDFSPPTRPAAPAAAHA